MCANGQSSWNGPQNGFQRQEMWSCGNYKNTIGSAGEKNEIMEVDTIRSVLAYLAELRRDREYHRTVEHATIDPKEESIHNRSKGHGGGDGRRSQDSRGQGRNNL